jgi:hypothetical protein
MYALLVALRCNNSGYSHAFGLMVGMDSLLVNSEANVLASTSLMLVRLSFAAGRRIGRGRIGGLTLLEGKWGDACWVTVFVFQVCCLATCPARRICDPNVIVIARR